MGVLDRLGLGRRTRDLLSSGTLGLASPWQTGTLNPVLVGDIFGPEMVANLPVDRSLAITVPAVSKARNLLVATIAALPLVALRGDTPLPDTQQPTFLYRTNTAVTPLERMAWTVDDLIFYGYSLWAVQRGARDGDGRAEILDAEWVPQNLWTITAGQVLIDEQPVAPENYILFNSPFEGLLAVASRTIRGARDQEAAWTGRARNPIPLIELHQMDDTLSQDEVKPFVDAWSLARRSENGAIGYTPQSIEIRTHGEVAADLMVEGRNAVRTDIGSFLNIRAAMLDGTIGIDSLTYTTKEGERNSFYEFDLPFWTDPIEARLSMDDVVPRGQRVRFDKSAKFNPPTSTGPTSQD